MDPQKQYMDAIDERFDKVLQTDSVVRIAYDLVIAQMLLTDQISQQTRREYACKFALVVLSTVRSDLTQQIAMLLIKSSGQKLE